MRDRSPPPTSPMPTSKTNAAASREQHDQYYLPIANLVRIMRKVLPPYAKISDDAKEKIQESVSEYICFITSEANDRCLEEKRKTVTAEDIIWAMHRLGFDDYVRLLTVFLERYRELEEDRRGSIRGPPTSPSAVTRAAAYADPFPQGAGLYASHVQLQPSVFSLQPATLQQQLQEQLPPVFGVLGDPMAGYYFGDVDGAGNGTSSQFQALPSQPPSFDPFATL